MVVETSVADTPILYQPLSTILFCTAAQKRTTK